jgi:hypothetical protein
MYDKLVKWKTRVLAQDPKLNPNYNEQRKTEQGKAETRSIIDPNNLN